MKASIRKYCKEGNDITTAAEMRNALKQRPVKGTTVSVNNVNVHANELIVNKVDGSALFIISRMKKKECGYGKLMILVLVG